MNSDVWYFAYGSNMDPHRKELRTGLIREAKTTRLPNYRFTFNKRGDDGSGKANIVPDEKAKVWGVIFRCTKKTLDRLDKDEGAPKHYRRQTVSVFTDEDVEYEAITYVAQDSKIQDGLKPTSDYLKHIIDGARHYKLHELDQDYITEIEKLA